MFKNPKNMHPNIHIFVKLDMLSENQYGIPKTVSVKMTSKSDIYSRHIRILLPHMKTEIPIFILFKLLVVNRIKKLYVI